jgi:hypothetical protein
MTHLILAVFGHGCAGVRKGIFRFGVSVLADIGQESISRLQRRVVRLLL